MSSTHPHHTGVATRGQPEPCRFVGGPSQGHKGQEMNLFPKSIETIDNDNLCCPQCGETWLHHGKVSVFNRAEDKEQGTHVCVSEDSVKVNTDLAGNPSLRRHGVTIEFICEICHHISTLAIAQHKGQSEVYWIGSDRCKSIAEGFYW